MADVLIYLQLAQEFGATKFGPFPNVEIRLGSDPENSDITLPENLGVAPQHVKVLKQQDGSFIISPIDRTCTVFVWRMDGRPPKQITTPIAATAGDGFSLVAEEGVRFYIVVEEVKKAKKKDEGSKSSLGRMKKGLSVGSMMKEIKRQGFAQFMRTGLGHWWQTGYQYVVSGAILRPRNIIMFITVASGWIFAGGVGCTALKLGADKGEIKGDYQECQKDLAEATGGGDGEEPTIPDLTQSILVDLEWKNSLQTDSELNQRYIAELRKVFQRREKYKWVYKRNRSDFTEFQSALKSKGFSEDLARVMAYIAAPPGFVPDREWTMLKQNSAAKEACGRGPATMTYRQARNLEIANVALDALVSTAVADGNDTDAKRTLLIETAGPDTVEFKEDEVENAPVTQGGFQCLYIEGDDDRIEVKNLAKGLARQLSDDARGMPERGRTYWITARIMRFYAADFVYGYEELKWNQGMAPSLVLEDASDDQKTFVLDSTAEVIARAVAIPCLARLDRDLQSPPEHMGELPSLVKCGVLNLLADRESFN